jgi:hypothetical protein
MLGVALMVTLNGVAAEIQLLRAVFCTVMVKLYVPAAGVVGRLIGIGEAAMEALLMAVKPVSGFGEAEATLY